MGLIAWLEEHEATMTFLIGLSGAAAISALIRAVDTPLEFPLHTSWWIFVFWWTLFGPLLGVYMETTPPHSPAGKYRAGQRWGTILLTAHIVLALVTFFFEISMSTDIMILTVMMGFFAPLFGGIWLGSSMMEEHLLEAKG